MKANFIKIFSLLVLVVVSAVSCNKDNGQDMAASLVGQWELTSSDKVDISAEGISVYVDFFSTGRFELYQKIGSGEYRYFSGNYSLSSDLLTGHYSDGTAWGASYKVSVTGGILSMTSQNEAAETCTYTSCTIPSSVITDSITRSITSPAARPWL